MDGTGKLEHEPWGTRVIQRSEAEAFAASLDLREQDRERVAQTLHDFLPDGMVRGMFFVSLRGALVNAIGEETARTVQTRNAIGDRFVPFALYPHRNFYRFWFAAIPKTHPGRSVAEAIERISETFFPVFLESAAGRTMAALMLGSDPLTIVRRMRDAYSMSVPHNEHKLSEVSSSHVRWDAVVESSPYYVETFVGILRGAMDCQRATMPKVTWDRCGAHGKHHQRIVFDLEWD